MPWHISYCKSYTLNLQSFLDNLIWSPDAFSSDWLSCLLQCCLFFGFGVFFSLLCRKIFFTILLILMCLTPIQREPPRLAIRPHRYMEKTLAEVWNIQIPKHFCSETLQLKTLQEILISTNYPTGKHCPKTAFISVANRHNSACLSCSSICLYFAGNLWESTVYYWWSQQNRYLPRRIRYEILRSTLLFVKSASLHFPLLPRCCLKSSVSA